jgi:hypothetical protein
MRSERNGNSVVESSETIIVQKNRRRAFWALIIVLFFIPVSGILVYLGARPGREDIGWAIVIFGLLGLVTFSWSAIMIVRTMRSPWHLEVNPVSLVLYTPGYDLEVPWDSVAGIAVDRVGRKLGCVLIFEDVDAVVQRTLFHSNGIGRGAVTNAGMMQAQMDANFERLGYHLGIPGRILEMDADELAALLARARTGELRGEEAQA